jgi:vitamin B12 transporter
VKNVLYQTQSMKLQLLLSGISILAWGLAPGAIAQTPPDTLETATTLEAKSSHAASVAVHPPVLRLNEVVLPDTSASLLLRSPHSQHQPLPNLVEVAQIDETETDGEEEEEIEIVVEGDATPPTSTPVYTIDADEIRKQGSDSVAEVLRSLPGFAVNDAGYGADIHTGTYYRGASINQSVFLLNGRPIGSNISTYHGATDLNSIPVGAIERIELSSGTASTLYGSEAFGGIVNIITKEGEETPKLNGLLQFGAFSESNYQGQFTGGTDTLRYAFSYQNYEAENNYRVPVGAANRGPDGRLFNGDSAIDSYYGNLSLALNPRNNLSLDVTKLTSRRGLLYFGFPLQRDRLDHDGLNVGLSWKAMLGNSDDSVLRTTLSYNQDYFSTYGPTQRTFYRTGILNSRAFNGRIEHDWQTAANNNLRWGMDLKQSLLNAEADSTAPNLLSLNEVEDRDRFHTALFALNTWKITDTLQTEFGLRQNFNSQFGGYLNPSVGTRWAMSPSVALRGSWVSVHRDPGLDQLYVFDTVHNWLPNPDLDPETGSSWTAGMDVAFASNLVGQFTYFGSRLNDRLSVRNGRWENIGLVNTNGVEVALQWKISSQWSTFLNYTYTDAKIQTGPERGLQLGLIPFSVASFGIGYESNGWQVNLYARYFSGARRALFTSPGDSIEDFSPSWLNLDLSLRIPLVRGIGLTVFLENLTDQTYEKANRIYQPGLTVRVGLQSNY